MTPTYLSNGPTLELTIAPHEGMSLNTILHLYEGKLRYSDGTGSYHLEAGLLVEWNQEVLAHEHSTSYVWQASQVLLVAPHQNRPFSLLAEGPMNGQHVNMNRVAMWLVKSECILAKKYFKIHMY